MRTRKLLVSRPHLSVDFPCATHYAGTQRESMPSLN
jgi:hypothetical protein